MRLFVCALALVVLALCSTQLRADEGMWTVNNFPRAKVKAALGVELDDAWLEHQRLSAVRFNSGGSGSFVSQTGLVLTNHHVGADCIAKLGKTERDYYKDGFYATKAADELPCPDLELNVLLGIEDVTAQVRADGRADATEAERAIARKEKIASIEKACADKTHKRCDVVTLYRGGRYDLYRYQKYVDVRLVFAPEGSIAFFGGDADNFMYPRYDLDVAIFRVYEGGKAVKPAHALTWAAEPAREADPVFTVGHPGNTERLSTSAMLDTDRELVYPLALAEVERLREALVAYGKTSADAERAGRKTLFSVMNSRKAYGGYFAGLKDPVLGKRKLEAEARMRTDAAGKPSLAVEVVAAYDTIAAAEKVRRSIHERWAYLEGRSNRAFTQLNPMGSRLFGVARGLVRLVDEQQKPSDKRLREYGEAGLASLELELYSAAPIDLGLEEVLLTDALTRLQSKLGAADPIVRAALAGKKPMERARALVRGTKLVNVAERHRLASSRALQDAAHDPMLDLARAIDTPARALRARMEDQADGPEERALGTLSRAQLTLAGDAVAPDATFTLRISYGRVLGYREGDRFIPPITVFGGLFLRSQKANDQAPWKLPQRWVDHKSKLRPTTPMNMVSTNDIIGGNSGSPLVNARGELVGLVFDENIHGLAHIFGYHDDNGRAVSVHTLGILEALRNVYDAGALADELTGNARVVLP